MILFKCTNPNPLARTNSLHSTLLDSIHIHTPSLLSHTHFFPFSAFSRSLLHCLAYELVPFERQRHVALIDLVVLGPGHPYRVVGLHKVRQQIAVRLLALRIERFAKVCVCAPAKEQRITWQCMWVVWVVWVVVWVC